jgi:vacuolar-type H+-ATPase subunit H
MAQDALLKIKQAEKDADLLVRQANDDSRKLLSSSQEEAKEKERELAAKNEQERQKAYKAAEDDAKARSETILAEGKKQVEKIENIDSTTFERAVALIVEMIAG